MNQLAMSNEYKEGTKRLDYSYKTYLVKKAPVLL